MEETIHPGLSVGAWGHLERPAFADLYAVAGRFISIESEDGQLAELFRRLCCAYSLRKSGASSESNIQLNEYIFLHHQNSSHPIFPALKKAAHLKSLKALLFHNLK